MRQYASCIFTQEGLFLFLNLKILSVVPKLVRFEEGGLLRTNLKQLLKYSLNSYQVIKFKAVCLFKDGKNDCNKRLRSH